MTSPARDNEDVTANNIFRITDELVYQVDKTKKMIIIMIIAVVVAVPVSWHVAPIFGGSNNFRLVGYATILIAAIFLAIGVRQWFVLSKWTKKYKNYQALQKRIDDKLDFEKD